MLLNQSNSLFVYLFMLCMSMVWDMGLRPKPIFSRMPTQMESILKVETDSIQYEVWIVSGQDHKPDYYYGEIFTPVCYSRTCLPVNINFRWDLLGNYEAYELPKGKKLTKSDHLEFDKNEYEKLKKILSNENSILKNYKADQLVTSSESKNLSGVDAITGATIKSIQNEVISGAVYSCYTLWHIAHGEITQKLKQNTETRFSNDDLIIRFLESSNYRYQYWAIEKTLINGQIVRQRFKQPLLNIINGKNVFISNYLLKELSPGIFNDREDQKWLLKSFLNAPYSVQVSILKKLNQVNVSPETSIGLVKHLAETGDEQKKMIFGLLAEEKNLDQSSQKTLYGFLHQPKWKTQAYTILKNQKKHSPEIKAELTAFLKSDKALK